MISCKVYDCDTPYVEYYVTRDQLSSPKKKVVDDCPFDWLTLDTGLQLDPFDNKFFSVDAPDEFVADDDTYNSRLHNISRLRTTVYDYAVSNKWQYFGTITLNGKNCPRDDISIAYKKLSKFLNNYKTRYSSDFQYLILPELHSDQRSWHFHGLFSNMCEDIISFRDCDVIPRKIAKKLAKGEDVYKWLSVDKTFGFCSLISTCGSDVNCAKYMAKYISKSAECLSDPVYKYFRFLRTSSNLRKPLKLVTDALPDDARFVYQNEYVIVYRKELSL